MGSLSENRPKQGELAYGCLILYPDKHICCLHMDAHFHTQKDTTWKNTCHRVLRAMPGLKMQPRTAGPLVFRGQMHASKQQTSAQDISLRDD
eukprot:1160025-Pelagomonas_calceolata.AAC.2